MLPALMTFGSRGDWSSRFQLLRALPRFSMEMVALGLLAGWGFTCSTDPVRRYIWLLAVPLLAATIWGTFTVTNDPSRGKNGPVPVSGRVRLGVEAAFFACAVAACYALSTAAWAAAFGALVCLHYGATHARVRWLLAQR